MPVEDEIEIRNGVITSASLKHMLYKLHDEMEVRPRCCHCRFHYHTRFFTWTFKTMI